MSNTELLRLTAGLANETPGHAAAIEKQLQSLIEARMPTMT